ncbi:MAG: hypothetical protein ACJZ49_07345 [Candidatus Thalassarchaeaceae archaeon]
MCNCSDYETLFSSSNQESMKEIIDNLIILQKTDSNIDTKNASVVETDDKSQSFCCGKFIEFLETQLLEQYILKGSKESAKLAGITENEYLANVYKWFDELSNDDCKEFLERLRKMHHGNPFPRTNSVNSSGFWLDNFEKCLNGEDYDFTSHSGPSR